MSARSSRGLLTINNISEVAEDSPDYVLDEIQSIIDGADLDLPDEVASSDNVRVLMHRQAYYGNQYPYLVGLWGAMKTATPRTNARGIAIRDYLEKAASACKLKFESSSRILTGYQEINRDTSQRRI